MLIENVESIAGDAQPVRVVQPTLEGRDMQKGPHRIRCHAPLVAVWPGTQTLRLGFALTDRPLLMVRRLREDYLTSSSYGPKC